MKRNRIVDGGRSQRSILLISTGRPRRHIAKSEGMHLLNPFPIELDDKREHDLQRVKISEIIDANKPALINGMDDIQI
ncbi:hypothetical protein D3C80_2114450 [compost metagenome]